MCGTGNAGADDPPPPPPPPLRHVKYTVTSETPSNVEIYYRDVDPPNWADYSHNSYQYTPKVEADVGARSPVDARDLAGQPRRWAMVVATNGVNPGTPNFHCEMTVDNAVASTDTGPKGALCSIRPW